MKESVKTVEGTQFQSEDEELLLEEKESLRKLRIQREERLRHKKHKLEAQLEECFEPPRSAGGCEEKGIEQEKSNTSPLFSLSGMPDKISKCGTSEKGVPENGTLGKPSRNMLVLGVVLCLLLASSFLILPRLLQTAEDAGVQDDNPENIPDSRGETLPASSAPSSAASSEMASGSLIDSTGFPESLTISHGMEFVLVPAGEFLMGSPEGEAGRETDEGPVHPVKVEKPFYLGKYEVTRGQWCEIMEIEPPSRKESERLLPATDVSWEDVQAFIKKLNEREGTDKYRLPSEAEWEYACRAGNSAAYSFGDDESELAGYAWFAGTSGSGSPFPVGRKEPNVWGLYDMHGNAWEWVQDTWHNDYTEAPDDGRAWEGGVFSYRVTRGGSVTGSAADCRAANRIWFTPNARSPDLGFRLLRET